MTTTTAIDIDNNVEDDDGVCEPPGLATSSFISSPWLSRRMHASE